MYKNPTVTNVPGVMPSGSKKEKQGYIQDISKLNKCELLDLKMRQELLLQNKKRIAKLPDKGLKIENFYKQILEQLNVHTNVDLAAEMFSELNISSVGKKSLTKMEWSGKYNAHYPADTVDSDDEIDDNNIEPLKILAQSTNVGKIIIAAKPKDTLITPQDLEDIEEFKKEHAQCSNNNVLPNDQGSDGHSNQLGSKHFNIPSNKKFLPFRTTTSNVHDPEKEKQRHKAHLSTWENTSATPPSLKHSPAKVLSLEESVQLQEEKNNLLQQAQEQYAEERLLQRQKIKEEVSSIYVDVMEDSTGLTTYRDVSDSEEEFHEYEDAVEYDSETLDS